MSSNRRKKTLAAADFAAIPETATRIGDGYPRLITRLTAAVYQRATVEFTQDPLHLGSDASATVYRVLDPTPDAGEVLTPERRAAAVDAATWMAEVNQLRMCVTFGRKDVVYVWPNGETREALAPPSGGLDPGEVVVHRGTPRGELN
jgi:hypothetical protein